jgi:hypothetical protein
MRTGAANSTFVIQGGASSLEPESCLKLNKELNRPPANRHIVFEGLNDNI